MISIGKIITALLGLLLAVCLTTQASAASADYIAEEINHCQHLREVAHQMAECARELGYQEDHPAILSAKESWQKAMDEETELNNQLENLKRFVWDGPILTKRAGTVQGPSGRETYYNLPMGGVVKIMRNIGFSESEFPYWVRDDGVRMLGDLVMIATNFSHWPRGSIVETSLGRGLSCDTGNLGWNHVDVAVIW